MGESFIRRDAMTERDDIPDPSSATEDAEIIRTRQAIRDPLTYAIIGAAQKVHSALGPGFAEATYQAAMQKELMNRKIPFESQREFEVFYEDTLCGTYRPDLVVADRVIVELKAVRELARDHWAQALSYLKASRLPAALLLNFGRSSLEVKRLKN
ncbi:MAG TPA: GxxExxY protein [Phycisphaerae bacterium]|nr:GxxExxY protein [Phycisphaerae bacterium]